MSAIKFDSYGRTDCGKVRSKNEDAFCSEEKLGLFAVADGLGGVPMGEVASSLAIKFLLEEVSKKPLKESKEFKDLFYSIRTQINIETLKNSFDLGLATTLTAGVLHDTKLLIGHVGDSGVILFRGKELKYLTKSHTMADEAQKKSVPVDQIPEQYHDILVNCIGQLNTFEVEVSEYDLRSGDKLVFYSDGLTKAFEDDELLSIVSEKNNPKLLVDFLVDEANNRGGVDNITVIAVYIL